MLQVPENSNLVQRKPESVDKLALPASTGRSARTNSSSNKQAAMERKE